MKAISVVLISIAFAVALASVTSGNPKSNSSRSFTVGTLSGPSWVESKAIACGATCAMTPASPITAGETVVVYFYNNPSGSPPYVHDDGGNTYVELSGFGSCVGNPQADIFYSHVTATANTVTATNQNTDGIGAMALDVFSGADLVVCKTMTFTNSANNENISSTETDYAYTSTLLAANGFVNNGGNGCGGVTVNWGTQHFAVASSIGCLIGGTNQYPYPTSINIHFTFGGSFFSGWGTGVWLVKLPPLQFTVSCVATGTQSGEMWANVTSGVAPYNYTWNFADGAFGYTTPVTHTWAYPDNYNITITVRDSASRTVSSYCTLAFETTIANSTLSWGMIGLYFLILATMVILGWKIKEYREG